MQRPYPDVSDSFKAKQQRRLALAALSWEDKVAIVKQMQQLLPRGQWKGRTTDKEVPSEKAVTQQVVRTGFIERRDRIENLDRSFDLEFWQAQSAQARFSAAWELVLHVCRVKGIDVRQLRLQRSVEAFGRLQR